MKKIIINQEILEDWILRFIENDSLMLTISEPHNKIARSIATGENLEPIIDKIIKIINRNIFGKYQRKKFLDSIIVEQNYLIAPHYHILIKKPEKMNFEIFENKLKRISSKFCSEKFKFDLSDVYLSNKIKNILSKPCYDKFAYLSEGHDFLRTYLTQKPAKYYFLQGRGFNRKNDVLDIFVKFKESKFQKFFCNKKLFM